MEHDRFLDDFPINSNIFISGISHDFLLLPLIPG